MDREPNLFVLTEAPSVLVELPFLCFYRAGVYEARQLAFLDKTGGQVGAVDAVFTQRPLDQGTRVTVTAHVLSCNVSGESYRVYEVVTGSIETHV
jgi:hypothetical protein